MGIEKKLQSAKNSTWLSDALTMEEKVAATISAEIASFLQKYRKSHGLTQQDLAEILHISNDKIICWEDGDEDFTIANLAKIATLLNIRLSNLFGVIDEIIVG
jgi:DNA-binding XRE family transcriptional regulator